MNNLIFLAIITILIVTILNTQVQAQTNITAIIEINEQSILDHNGSNVNDAWFVIDEQRYGIDGDNGSYADMSDWVYPTPSNEDGSINSSPLSYTLVLPPKSEELDNGVKICLEDSWEYKSCQSISYGEIPKTISFLYPGNTRPPITR